MIPPLLSLIIIGLVAQVGLVLIRRERIFQNSRLIGLFLAVYLLDNIIIVTTNR